MAGDEGDDRRVDARELTCYPFYVQTGDTGDTGAMDIAIIRDLSPSGAYLFVGVDLSVGTRVKLHLDFAEPPKIVEGRVVRAERTPEESSELWPFGAAVRFDERHEDLEPHALELARKVASSGAT